MFRNTRWAGPLIASLLVTACGGGGVSSTGTPAGDPTPTPTPSPSPTPTPGPTLPPPTSTPAADAPPIPIPPSSGTTNNGSLVGTLVSETFAANGADMTARFHSDGSPVDNSQAQSASLAVSYDAATQSYTVSTAGRTQTFAAADALASNSSDFNIYQKISGTVGEWLVLTKPGNTGPLNYQYVGGGGWERRDDSSGTLDFAYAPFTYGAYTADAALQRTGTGTFAVNLVGVRAVDKPYAMAGEGIMQVDFQNGTLSSSGKLTTIDVNSGLIQSLGQYYGSASLSSTTNNFSGTFSLRDDTTRLDGGWAGRFYGPSNEEVGATWHISNSDGEFAAGYLLGRSDSSVATGNDALTALQFSESFTNRFAEIRFSDLGGGMAATGATLARSDSTLAYDATAASYRYVDSFTGIDTTFTSASKSLAQSNSAVDVYEMTDGSGIGYRLTLSRPGAGNPQIALTYASFGHWEQFQSASADARDRWFTWGVRTNWAQIPTGTGHYDGIVAGKAVMTNGGMIYNLSGASSVDVDFGGATFAATMNAAGTSLSNGSNRDFGTFALTGGRMDANGGLTGDFYSGANWAGYFEGALYGPHANEVGGMFGLQTGSGANAATLNGVILGKRN